MYVACHAWFGFGLPQHPLWWWSGRPKSWCSNSCSSTFLWCWSRGDLLSIAVVESQNDTLSSTFMSVAMSSTTSTISTVGQTNLHVIATMSTKTIVFSNVNYVDLRVSTILGIGVLLEFFNHTPPCHLLHLPPPLLPVQYLKWPPILYPSPKPLLLHRLVLVIMLGWYSVGFCRI